MANRPWHRDLPALEERDYYVVEGCCHSEARPDGYIGAELDLQRMNSILEQIPGSDTRDNHSPHAVGKNLSGAIDDRTRLLFKARIPKDSPTGRAVVSGKYQGASLGMVHHVDYIDPTKVSRVGQVDWNNVKRVNWSKLIEISLCRKGKTPGTYITSYYSEDAHTNGDGTSPPHGRVFTKIQPVFDSIKICGDQSNHPPTPRHDSHEKKDTPSGFFQSAYTADLFRDSAGKRSRRPKEEIARRNNDAHPTMSAPQPATPPTTMQQQQQQQPRAPDGRFLPPQGQPQQSAAAAAPAPAPAAEQSPKPVPQPQAPPAGAQAPAGDQQSANEAPAAATPPTDQPAPSPAPADQLTMLQLSLIKQQKALEAEKQRADKLAADNAEWSKNARTSYGCGTLEAMKAFAKQREQEKLAAAHESATMALEEKDALLAECASETDRQNLEGSMVVLNQFVKMDPDMKKDSAAMRDAVTLSSIMGAAAKTLRKTREENKKREEAQAAELGQSRAELQKKEQENKEMRARMDMLQRQISEIAESTGTPSGPGSSGITDFMRDLKTQAAAGMGRYQQQPIPSYASAEPSTDAPKSGGLFETAIGSNGGGGGLKRPNPSTTAPTSGPVAPTRNVRQRTQEPEPTGYGAPGSGLADHPLRSYIKGFGFFAKNFPPPQDSALARDVQALASEAANLIRSEASADNGGTTVLQGSSNLLRGVQILDFGEKTL